jgi:hypothetical protein
MKRFWIVLFIAMLSLLTQGAAVGAQTTANVWVSIQKFERGMMLWRSDNSMIWVLSDKGQAKSFSATVYSHLRDNRIKTSPTGRVPMFGFGKVWGNYASVRRMIGSPTASEGGVLMIVQEVGGNTSMTQTTGTTYNISSRGTWTSSIANVVLNPRVQSLSTNTSTPAVGDELVISWSVTDTNSALLEIYDGNSETNLYAYMGLAPSGSVSITVPPTANQKLRIVATAANKIPGAYDRKASAELMVNVVAATQTTTVTTYAAYQAFEHGFMVWRSDNDDVYVFGSGVTIYDTAAGLPDNIYTTPPDGLIAPINAFGRVWSNNDYLRTNLGWATGSEQGYQATVTYTGRVETMTEFTLSLPGGRVLTLYNGGGSWRVR